MGRAAFAVIALAGVPAHADPAVSAQVGGIGGVGYASLAGGYVDDKFVALRVSVGIGQLVAADFGASEDVDRVEPAVHLGARVRPCDGGCWRTWWSPYFRADVAAVAATHLGDNYDLTVGAGHWGKFSSRVPWLGWYSELDGVARVGEVQTWSLHVELGVTFATSAFWR